MFWKLSKFELKNSYRSFLVIYVIILISALLISPDNTSNVGMQLVLFIYSIALFSLIIMAFVNVIRNYSKSMFSSESYLTHTLPVSEWKLLLVKVICGMFWIMVSIFIILISAFMIGAKTVGIDFQSILQFFEELGREIAFIDGLGVLISYVAGTLESVILFYMVMTIVHTKWIPRFKTLAAVVLFFLVSWVLGMLTVGSPLSMMTSSTYIASARMSTIGYMDSLWVNNIITILISGLFFYITAYILKKRLEIE